MDGQRLYQCPLFHHLSARRRERLMTAAALRRYARGQTLFRQGKPADAVWVVLRGWVHLVRTEGSSNRTQGVVLFTITPSEALCGVSSLEAVTYTATGVAATESDVLRIPAALMREALTHEPRFAYAVLCLYTERLRHMAIQYGTMVEPVSQRLVRTILRLRRQFGVTLPVTHRELAQMSWTTTESAIRWVRALKRQGYVTGARGRLTIRKVSALEALLGSHDGSQRMREGVRVG